MRKSNGRMCRVLAIWLAGAVFLSNQDMYSVFAAKNEISEEGLLGDAPKEGIIPKEAAYQEGMLPDGGEGKDVPEDEGLPEDGGADKKDTISGNVPGTDSCLPGKVHEYEEVQAQDGTIVYQCVFCKRIINAETFIREGAVYHKHTWDRAEGEIIPVCQSCEAERLDCKGENGYGVHIFELIQEEGRPDKYQCLICGVEKETLDEWDLTVEEFRKIMDISLYAQTYRFGDEVSELPTNQAELKNYKEKKFLVRNLADLMALQKLGESDGGFDFEGYSIQFIHREQADGSPGEDGGRTWDLTPLKGFFHGIGSDKAPFKGELTSSYDYGTLRFRTAMPLLNYAATGATVSKLQISADIKGDGTSPTGIIAAHVAASGMADTVKISEVSVSGTVSNPGGAAGILFGEVENKGNTPVKLCYEASSTIELGIPGKGGAADAPADVSGGYAGGLAGKIKGIVEVHKTDVFPMGTVTGTVCAGMLAGSMEDGSVLYVDGTDDEKTVQVGGSGISGGLAGRIEKGKVVQTAGNARSFSVTGSVKGNSAGGLVGECIDTEISLGNVKVSADVVASAKDAGGVIGYFKGKDVGNANGADWHLLHHITVTGNVSGGSCAGGAVGRVEGSNFRIGLPGEADNFQCMQVEGTVSASGAAGGMIGDAKGEYIEIYHASVKGGVGQAAVIGGMIGSVGDGTKRSVVKVTNASISSTLDPRADQKIQGGIFGNIRVNSMAALDRNIDVRGLEITGSSPERGYIAGKQEEALVYFEENGNYQRTEGKAWVDDIGSYGGVYKNGSWGEGSPLISYVEKAVKGTVTGSGNAWTLDTEADIIRLAIMLNSEGRFAANCFPGANKGILLASDYSLENPADGSFDLEESGIYSLNRNDRGKADAERFTGKLIGAGEAVIRLGICTTYQSYLSLFPYAGEGAEFRNLTLEREIHYAREAAAGLCAYASGNIKVHNVDMRLTMTGSQAASPYLYGGMFAQYRAGGDVELSVTQSRIGGRLEINQSTGAAGEKQYGGGLLAKYEADLGSVPVIKIQDLELAEEIVSSSRFVSGMITQINTENESLDKGGDRVILALKNITVTNDAEMAIQDREDTGGFLGWKWYGIAPDKSNYSINGLTVGEGGTADDGPAYSTGGNYGGLVHTVTGRIQLKDVKIQNGSFYATPGESNHNGLLFHNGHKALIELEGYQIAGQDVGAKNINYTANNAKVRITGETGKFSEIVGNNIGKDKNNRNHTMGGIVNIISPAFGSDFVAYRSHLLKNDAGSDNARYYYNLFGSSLADGDSFMAGRELDGAAMKLTDGDQIMIWHLSQYMNDSIRRYLKPYFINGIVPAKNEDITLSGEIDLNRRSYYPTPVENCVVKGEGKAKIIFHGDKIDSPGLAEGESVWRENYMLQGGLLLSPNGGMRVEGDEDFLTLAGKITRLGENSGALFSMSIKGTNQIYRIQLEDLYMNNYGGAAHGYGLLIGAVEDNSDIDISWIRTKGYNGSSRQKYAAAALIGRVGNTWAKNLKLDFTNVKIGGKNPDRNPADKSEGIFRFASFIDIHQYTDNTQENKGRVRYLFTEEAYKGMDMADTSNSTRDPFTGGIHGDNNYKTIGGYVTVGRELENGVEYWNTEGEADLVAAIADWNVYLPYVCTSHDGTKNIQVNPKNVSITEGCGIYEDPYRIDSAKQLLALSYYLMYGNNQQYLEGWQIRKPGDKENTTGDGICTKTHTKGTLRTYGNSGFPTQEELRKAYYVVAKDIDFSELRGSGDAAIVQSFVGLGTETFPFSGVIAGEENNGTYPVITLPHKRKGNTSNYYGFIQFAKGAVIKDIKIISPEVPENDNDRLTNVARVGNSGGSAIACILGGDNIIDNVTTESLIAVDAAGAGRDAAVGGYVGTLQQGSLILRNLSEDNLSGFCWGLLRGSNEHMESGMPDLSDYPYVSGIVGKVENGFVVYEGGLSNDATLPHGSTHIPGIYRHDALPFSNTYDVITAAGMAGEKGSIPIISGGGDYICNIANGAQLQLVSMAINSDSFSVYYDGGGYDKKASCRKADYTEIGNVTGLTSEYTRATRKDDNVYWYPYIYQYFSFDGVSADDSDSSMGNGFYRTMDSTPSGYRSRLNAVTNAVRASMTYTLTDDGAKEVDYDLSVYGRGFRGLGATYRVFREDSATVNLTPRGGVYSDFRANFNGNGATVKAEMVNDYAKGIHTAALFNDLVNTDAVNNYFIKDVVVTGTFKSSNSMEGNAATNYSADRAAAVIGMMRRPWAISNVTVKNVDVWSKGHAAGIAAWINLPSNNEKGKRYSFTDCQVLSDKGSLGGKGVSIHAVGGSSGGIIGVMGSWHTDALNGYELELIGCRVAGEEDNGSLDYYVSIENEGDRTGMSGNTQEGNARGRCGALIGHVGKHHDGNPVETQIKLTVTGKAGIADVRYAALDGGDSAGGIIGEYYGWRKNENEECIKISGITVSDSIIESKNRNETEYGTFGTGGIIGKLQRKAFCAITDTEVINTNIRSAYDVETGSGVPAQGDLHAGGLIGSFYWQSKIRIDGVQVRGDLKDGRPQYEILSRLSNAGGLIGASVEGKTYSDNNRSDVVITDAKVSGMNILSDDRRQEERVKDSATGTSKRAAGGIVGLATMTTMNLQKTVVEECVIQSGSGAAGGVIGQAGTRNAGIETWADTTLDEVSVAACMIGTNGSISDMAANAGCGGIYGSIYAANDKGSQKLAKIAVDHCDIYGKNAGGIAGIVCNSQQIGNVWSDGNKGHALTISHNRLLGYMAGGVFGADESKKTCFDQVKISGNLIAGFGDHKIYGTAGGFGGRKGNSENTDDCHNINHITIEDNRIFANNLSDGRRQSAGGVFGYLDLSKEIFAYHAVIKDNRIGYCEAAEKNLLGSLPEKQAEKIKACLDGLETKDAGLWDGNRFGALPAKLTEEDLNKYAGYFGNVAGMYEGGGHAYFLMPDVIYTDENATRPVVDVGSGTLSGIPGNQMLSFPYSYRENIHVVYYEPDLQNNTAAEAWKDAPMGRDSLFSQINAEAELEEYAEAVKSGKADRLLDAYRLRIADDNGKTVEEIYQNVYRNKEGYLSKLLVNQEKLPMIVIDTQYGTVDQLMGSVLALLTGAGGIHNSGESGQNEDYDYGISRIMDVSVKPMTVLPDGTIEEDMDPDRKNSIEWSVKENGRAELSYRAFDEEKEDGSGTFSLLTVTYKQDDYTGMDDKAVTGGKIVLQIPVFVVERLTIDTYLKMVEGEVYNADKAKREGVSKNPLLANDSSYTLYMEYIYGSARNKYSTEDNPICIDKTLGITYMDANGNAVPAKFWAGTRLTLIDVSDSSKVYYYTVKDKDTLIKFSQFVEDPKDPDSPKYKNKPIHGEDGKDIYENGKEFPAEDMDQPYTDVAVERFLIIVDTTLVDEELKLTTRNARDYHITPKLDEEIEKRTTLTEHTDLNVTMQPGLTLGFVFKGEENGTDVKGSIQDGEEVVIDATFEIAGEIEYWLRALNSQVTTIDSANHNKYLEVGIYLADVNGNRVRLPDNTNVTVNGIRLKPWEEEIKPEENIGSYVNRTAVYFYKDGKIQFSLDALKDMIQKDIDGNGANNIEGMVSEHLKIALNFLNADLADYTESNYVIHLELLRIEDADYPAGGELLDTYEEVVAAKRKTDMACALETKDLMELGVNTYQGQTPMPHEIHFDFKLDFNGIISNNEMTNQQIADKYYTVTYHILEKTNRNGTPVYKPYTGSQLSLALAGPPASDVQKNLEKGPSSTGEFGNSRYVTYHFSWNEIKKGTGNAGSGVITRDLVLTVQDAEKMDLSNYKIQASVMISDQPPGDIERELNEALSDFFVFTVAKLKTDLDY